MRPENVENNEETPLLGGNLNHGTLLWQHDNPWIRVPARIARSLKFTAHAILADVLWFFGEIANRESWISQRAQTLLFGSLAIIFIAVGVALLISLSHDGAPQGLFLIEFAVAFTWCWSYIMLEMGR